MKFTKCVISIVLISAFVSPLVAMETMDEPKEQESMRKLNEINEQISALEFYINNIEARLEAVAADAEKMVSPSTNRKNIKPRKDFHFNNTLANTHVKKLNSEELEEQIKVARRNLKIVAGTALVIGITIGAVTTKYYINRRK